MPTETGVCSVEGTITGGYEYHEDTPDYQHRRSVEWQSTAAVPAAALSPSLKSKLHRTYTIIELTDEEVAEIRRGGTTAPHCQPSTT